MIHSYSFSEIGQKPRQEDSLFPLQDNTLEENHVFLICDGLGGHVDGDVASKCVADTIGNYLAEQGAINAAAACNRFNAALDLAYTNLKEQSTGEQERPMGTTLAMLVVCTDGILTAHIGDSRVYQFRKGENPIPFCTRDHSYVNELYAAGKITSEEAQTHPQRGAVTRAIVANNTAKAQATFNYIKDIRPDDVFMICSDGLIEQVAETEIANILLKETSLAERAEELRQLCDERHTSDNYSCILITNVSEATYAIKTANDSTATNETANSNEAAQLPINASAKQQKKSWRRVLLLILLLILLAIGAIAYFAASPNETTPQPQPSPAKTVPAPTPVAKADTTALDSTAADSMATAPTITPTTGAKRRVARSYNNSYNNNDSSIADNSPAPPAEATPAPAPAAEEAPAPAPSDNKAQKPQRKPRQPEKKSTPADDEDWY